MEFPIFRRMLRTIAGVVAISLCCLFATSALAFEKGIAVTPKNFPAHSFKDLDDAFSMAHELGRYSVHIFQWRDLDLNVAKLLVDKARRAGLTPVLGLSPTTLDQGRKEIDLPTAVRSAAGARISFANPAIRKEFIATAERLAQLKPEYLCLATEINFLAIQRLDEFLQFVTLYKEAYAAVKRVSPRTKVFVSFQWEWMRIVDAKEPLKIAEHGKVISVFKPQLDVVGLTSYPATFHKTPADLPPDYYTWLSHHVDGTDRILLMELGWPTTGAGDEHEQEVFIQRLPALLSGVHVDIVAWALLHDVNIPQFDANLNTVGLVTNGGRKKKGLEAFRLLRH